MRRRQALAFGIAAVLLVVALVIMRRLGGPGPVLTDEAPPVTTLVSAGSSTTFPGAPPTTTVTLAGGVLTLQFPGDLALAVTGEPLLVGSTIPACDDGFDYCLYLPPGAYGGTNFRAAGMAIVVRSDLNGRLECLLTQPPGYEGLPARLVVEPDGPDGVSTTLFQVMDGAAGTYATGEVRRLYAAGTCYEFTLRVVESQFGNYPAGTIEEFTSEDRAAVFGEFYAVLANLSLRLPGGVRMAEWPLVRPAGAGG